MVNPLPSNSFDKEKYRRFERISEGYTYTAVVVGFFLTLLPYNFPFDKNALHTLLAFVLVFAVVWFRLTPKSMSGFWKTLVYYIVSIGFVAFAVHFTNGIQSYVIFLFYLTIVTAAAGLEMFYFSLMVAVVAGYLLIEASFFGTKTPFLERGSLALLHIWALLIIAAYSRYIFDEEARVKKGEKSLVLKNAMQLDMVKNEFVFVISNKLKEPIFSLQNYLETSSKSKDSTWSADLTELLGKTIENSQRLSSLVNDLSDLSKIESQKLRLELKPVILGRLISSTMSDFSMIASEKNISLSFKPSSKELIVKADSSRLHEILANLVDNAIKYSPNNGQITVWIEEENNFAKVVVKDNGFGIPEEAKAHLFEKFYRVNRSSREAKGTGLGLFVTKELVERQGGKIWYESQVGVGTTFFFTLLLIKDGNANS